MIDGSSNLLLNLLVIIITLTVHQFWVESKPNSTIVQKYAILFTSAAAILLCMVFSFYVEGGIQFDLRRVPLWFGTIYGGPMVGIILTVETILVRLFTGGTNGATGLIITLITSILFTAITILIRPFYFRLRTFNKVLIASAMITMFSIIILATVSINNNELFSFKLWSGFLLTNLIGIIFVHLSLEAIRRNYLLRMKILHSAKLDVLGHLAAAVNHEVKNPLTTVRGMMHLLKEDQSLPNEKREAFFQIAADEIDKIDKIVSDYLTFARPYPDKIEQISIEKVLSESIDIIKPLAEQAKIQLDISSFCPCHVSGDHSKFVQALVNILKNSIDASTIGGQIKVSTEIKEDLCIISIIDNGAGMSETTLGKLGEPYFTMTGNGTGLGMMVVFRIIESMNGKINIKSKLGIGTEVILEFQTPSYEKMKIIAPNVG
ncbi:HAMP domain-containing sensor histidine kinase [Bacillus sp. DTU_2020_1000418_1_SI_GHA_SEK_038]|uniref:HAMP domain-containing sensor histidine kinase n=1 Tax=Bacillus sp. DTU_2020_1000418_1_SI_GHA_SEK_038 TaxID=3077585 RepID=UPI0028E8F7E6|nr:HAMP domain-containing sensor histidine kinase [Bacillus sp. DTU_2020_1000418_1_SI_GHA_SEK_038]WNS74905.1 HAMP domain-containing sensor histidine kinase [Bacillus sp. DTU_2020_1000418_1_SI_GHA_SEK_038]